MQTLRTMSLFAAIAHHGSLSAAARKLGLSPASVSRQITALEEQLGARLLNRTSRSMTLTSTGEIFLRHAENILHQVEEMQVEVSQREQQPSGLLRVHSRMLVGTLVLMPNLPRFLQAHPQITVELAMSNHAIDLAERNVDVDIRIGKLTESALIARRLATSERVVCAAPAYLAGRPAIREPADLMRQNCLTYRLGMGRTVWRFVDAAGQTAEVPVTGSLTTDNGPALHAAALAGLGIALMPDWSVREDIRAGRLVRLFAGHRASHLEFENGVFAVYQRSRHLSARVRVFVDFLVEIFKDAER
ncbi:LysR family transcriptional regulator [Falsiroseomonas stagni]|uniref:Transcriptional regulator, LysR family n=1 Tax=Falsiroseomonas stagni DSM 19981 TaxID=1123062 RepID=A0A1I4CCS7_9PROT|nr:LysR family transcriptional regulator [Falsiroseomonas stagni]SFK78410.1 transcriptional regulator, LysR family [Falsiroseomonas stagni DSM 19981]